MKPLFAGLFGLSVPEMLVLAIIGVLLFARRLPEAIRNLGKCITEFRKGMKELDGNLGKKRPDEDEGMAGSVANRR